MNDPWMEGIDCFEDYDDERCVPCIRKNECAFYQLKNVSASDKGETMRTENCSLCGSNNNSSYFHYNICTTCYEYLRDCFIVVFYNELKGTDEP